MNSQWGKSAATLWSTEYTGEAPIRKQSTRYQLTTPRTAPASTPNSTLPRWGRAVRRQLATIQAATINANNFPAATHHSPRYIWSAASTPRVQDSTNATDCDLLRLWHSGPIQSISHLQ
eukprot:CAMPEP_0204429372 /NCGR_PEP_ID=MMETSP0470-20130426/60134_1 /ASSEMBLY_ACC=CAM_ASM_000385 /TAXON_ID=2969 /ORGANISM="Oxyrrhis marina" /LENGTH=118 /DNA_ID=CAMNT_0051427399 /DNA_START=308 /DNA_END=664 /DNA_ORIENTATION=+